MDPLESLLMNAKGLHKYVAAGVGIFVLIVVAAAGTFIIPPGHRGVLVTMGKVSPVFAPEGFGFKTPFITAVLPISIRQQTKGAQADCYSSDLQQISIELRVLYRIPESQVVRIFQEYSGDPFESLVAPRVAEALK